ncbi:hypothetical protein D3C73_387960 [compost metagenome]
MDIVKLYEMQKELDGLTNGAASNIGVRIRNRAGRRWLQKLQTACISSCRLHDN